MARGKFYVFRNGSRWKIRHLEMDYDYRTQAMAMKHAVEAAYRTGETGHAAQVLIQGHDGQWQTDWTYGHDRYPRRHSAHAHGPK
ncbi:hypothetical protein Bresu_0391 [Brevundimonas subvibrioides ATCC 15264]|uniref:DUF2188 domain-containing protein n=1 Tax=Brevundimonas subvibrioides (strain ATCC 15264 / DSM 4735 / LMG 14903 / NBRC 16000 / CB 81) TaxID=633149 RepID=D9QJV4_BRESC|nr:hypothetical protein Bresu_0391 [Brevundimonas subvibrioides ATCC 15264]